MKYTLLAATMGVIFSQSTHAATYKLEELATSTNAKLHYVTAFNNNGDAIGVTRGQYNMPIDTAAIDFDDSGLKSAYDNQKAYEESIDKTITFTLEDIENNIINADALTFLMTFLQQRTRDPKWQKISDQVAVDYLNEAEEVILFDQQSPDYEGLTRSVINQYTAVSEDNSKVAWGSAPYQKIKFTPEGRDEDTYFIRDFESRAVVVSPFGEKTTLLPVYDTHGGMSLASDITLLADGTYLVVGDSSTGIPEDRQKNLDDNCDGVDEPASVCIWSYKTSETPLFDRRAMQWHLDSEFNVISATELGLGLTPKDDEGMAFRSTAVGVNTLGLVVGYSDIRWKDTDSRVSMPVYFKDGNVIPFVDQEDDYYRGKSVAVNDDNIITGYATRRISGVDRSKFFYHDVTTGDTKFPEDFFSSASSIGRDINNNGLIVGDGEVETSTSTNRRREGFLYDINAEKFTNINDLLPCYDTDGKTGYPYILAEAIAINDNNVIVGAATKTVKKTDALGNLVLDVNGNQEFESVVVPVKLTPINGEVESCPPSVQEPYERKGASFAWLAFLMLPLVAWRRRG